jgi:hypothetical protein
VTGSPFQYISKLRTPSTALTMASRRYLSSARKSRRVSKQTDQGTLRSWVYSAAVRSDPSQENSLEVLRKNDHDEAHALKALHGFKTAVRIENLNKDTHLSQQKRHGYIHSGIPPRANSACGVTVPASFTIKEPKATPRGGAPRESHTDRAASKTSSTFTHRPFSQADV